MKMGGLYDEAIEAGLTRREASFLGAAEGLSKLAREMRADQARFLEEVGLTLEDARALDGEGRAALNEQWAAYKSGIGQSAR